MFDISNFNKKDYPPIISCMSDSEFYEFITWYVECCGYDPNYSTGQLMAQAAVRWYDEQLEIDSF